MTAPVDHAQLAAAIDRALQQLTHGASSLVPVVAIAREAAAALALHPERRWLDLELRGYADPRESRPQVLGEALGVDASSELPERVARCRALVGDVVLQLTPGAAAETLPYPYLATQSIADIEALLARGDGRIQILVGWDQLANVFREMFTQFGITARTLPRLPVHFQSTTFAEMYRTIRTEVAGFLSRARLMCRRSEAPPGSIVVQKVQAHRVQIVQAAHGSTVTINEGPANEDPSTMYEPRRRRRARL
jgi:hypothetical protein